MNSKKMDIDSRDLISKLPDELLCHILSFLITEDVALTSVLSKRWRYLLASVPTLDVDDSLYTENGLSLEAKIHLRESFKDFVDRVLALQANAPLNKCSISCSIGIDPSFVDRWIHKVLERGVVDLELEIVSGYGYDYMLPPKVLMSKTLVTLKVDGNNIDVGEVSLPNLKTLHVDRVEFNDKSGVAFAKLVSSCIALEELVVINVTWELWDSFFVSHPTLKRLIIFSDNDDENPKSISLDAPNLIYLEFSDVVAVKYPKVKLGSVVEARLDLQVTPQEHVNNARDCIEYGIYSRWPEWTGLHRGSKLKMVGNALNFLMGICNVQILYLAADTIEVLTFCCNKIPVFNYLVHLTIETHKEIQWASLPYLLENCPNLETLVFRGLYYRDTRQSWEGGNRPYSVEGIMRCWDTKVESDAPLCLASSPVKVLKIFKFGENPRYKKKEMDVIKYFVRAMPNLEQVIIHYDTPIDYDARVLLNAIQRFEKVASTKFKIKVITHNITISSIIHSS